MTDYTQPLPDRELEAAAWIVLAANTFFNIRLARNWADRDSNEARAMLAEARKQIAILDGRASGNAPREDEK